MSGPRRARVDALPAIGSPCPLSADASRHLIQVLRQRVGDAVELFDGAGLTAPAVITVADKRAAVVEVTGPPVRRAPAHALHLGLAVLKGSAMDDALRMATEAGATHIHPILAGRSVPTDGRPDRWQRITEVAAVQCLRADVPLVADAAPLHAVLDRLALVPDRRIATPGASRTPPAAGDAAVLVGPEGGWSPEERAAADRFGFAPLGLGAWMLRADTAAAVACALVAPPTAGARS